MGRKFCCAPERGQGKIRTMIRPKLQSLTVRVGENCAGGRDFVVGDVHGEFRALEALLARVGFVPECDRLFALGDLIDRGPRSADALAWMETGRIALSVRGNHEHMLLERLAVAETFPREMSWAMHPWFLRDVERADWGRWQAVLRAMPLAATVDTWAGAVGLVHAATTTCWDTMLERLDAGDSDTTWLAIGNTFRARRDVWVRGIRMVMTGHTGVAEPYITGNVWHIDTGAGIANGCLTLARIDVDPVETVTVPTYGEGKR